MRPTLGWTSQKFANPGAYASRRDRHGPAGHHTGVDYAALPGTPVRALRRGRVIVSEYNTTMGNWVVIRTRVGRNAWVCHSYWHLRTRKVRVGQRVRRGQRIGSVGSTGNSTGPHLHYQENRGRTFDYHRHRRPRFTRRRRRR